MNTLQQTLQTIIDNYDVSPKFESVIDGNVVPPAWPDVSAATPEGCTVSFATVTPPTGATFTRISICEVLPEGADPETTPIEYLQWDSIDPSPLKQATDIIKRDCWRRQWAIGTFGERTRFHNASEWTEASAGANIGKLIARVSMLEGDIKAGYGLNMPEGDPAAYIGSYLASRTQDAEQPEYVQYVIMSLGIFVYDAIDIFRNRVLYEVHGATWEDNWLPFIEQYKAEYAAECTAKGKPCPINESTVPVFDAIAEMALHP